MFGRKHRFRLSRLFRVRRLSLSRTGTQIAAVLLCLLILTGGQLEEVFQVDLCAQVGEESVQEITRGMPATSSFSLGSLWEDVTGFLGHLVGDILGESGEETWTYVGRPSYLDQIPVYEGEPYVWLEGRGDFTREEFSREPYEYYGPWTAWDAAPWPRPCWTFL